MRELMLREERHGPDERYLWAFVDKDGLHIDGQDLGPGTAIIGSDGEYEWSRVFAPDDIPKVIELLDGERGEDVLSVLQRWVGRADELEDRIGDSDIPHELFTYSG